MLLLLYVCIPCFSGYSVVCDNAISLAHLSSEEAELSSVHVALFQPMGNYGRVVLLVLYYRDFDFVY